ncbi:MAG: type III-B CRISPR module RAMP protein Cmr1 [Rhodocyclaceae bacterium]|nr:type III-B CRISPR module RAMP protein Cmr1 [Rhodocyclaceae bacterium]
MPLRTPPKLDPALALRESSSPALEWKKHECELITPLYGGGVTAGEVDPDMPVRASAIRGQLRYWWRLLARHKWKFGTTDQIRAREFELWGGLGTPPQASKVWVRISNLGTPDIKPWAKYGRNDKDGWKTLPDPEDWADAAYALFPGQGKKPGTAESKEPASLVKHGLKLHIELACDTKCSAEQRDQVFEALRWWASFGGLGARTRRGLGAIGITGLELVSAEEARAAGCRLVLAGYPTNSISAWKAAVRKLRDFRQGVAEGRNRGSAPGRPGRSRWPEPDAIRRLTRRHAGLHAPEHVAGNVFPRAAFGLPLIFHFKDTGDPGDFSLQPAGRDRMASPLILRPYGQGNQWRAAALLLPHAHLQTMELTLPNGQVTDPGQWWNPAVAGAVPPLTGRGTDALTAFLAYFVK